MTFERRKMMIITLAAISVAALFTFNGTDSITKQSIPEAVIQTAEAGALPTHTIQMEAVSMPDGMYAYKMVSYLDPDGTDLVETGVYTTDPTIPGPTIVITEGERVELTLKNNACDSKFLEGDVGPAEIFNVGVHVHGVHYDISDDATYQRVNMADETSSATCGEEIDYVWSAGLGTQGTWPYHDHTFAQNEVGAEHVGLFGTLIVNPADGMVTGLVDSETGIISTIDTNNPAEAIDKEFILWMVSSDVLGKSVFYGMEIDNGNDGKQTPLWVNPNLYATDGDTVRYHVLGLGDETHAFHLHGHRWVEAQGGSADIIDVKEITPLQRHTFLIKASDNENPIDGKEGWMYHCHVFDHMEQGMSGMMIVHPSDEEVDEMPPIGATFTLSDEPGLWMKTLDAGVLDDLDEIVEDALGLPVQTISKPGTGYAPKWLGLTKFSTNDFVNTEGRSLAILDASNPSTVLWNMKDSQTKHTITNLAWPAGAQLKTVDGAYEDLGNMDIDLSIRGSTFLVDSLGRPAMLEDPGLYVFVCKIHPYMFSAVLVDDPSTSTGPTNIIEGLPDVDVPVLDLSPSTTILTRSLTSGQMNDGNLIFADDAVIGDYVSTLPSFHPITTGIVKTFYVITDPNNWRDYTEDNWVVSLPPVPVSNGTDVAFLNAFDSVVANETFEPEDEGVGEVLVNTQFETTINKNHPGTPQDKPGTITVVNTNKWEVERKIALPEINMNHPHNMWANAKQDTIYQTQWFDSRLVAIDRESGEMIKDVFVGQSPSHVMTAPPGEHDGDNEGRIYIAMNGEEQVTELDPVTLEVSRQFSTGTASHPHGHWVSNDGSFVVTPNFFTSTSSVVDLVDPSNTENINVGFTPIATGMMPDGSKYFTADFLGNSFTVVDLENDEVRSIDLFNNDVEPFQGLPIQTPVSPDGQWMVTATVLQSTIIVVDANAEEIVAVIPCDPGCHGVQWGAKEGGGYYAYVSNKFSNALIVVDPKDGFNAEVVGKISLVEEFETETDDVIIGHAGMGGQGLLTVPNVYNGWIQQTAELCDVPGKGKNKEPCGTEISRFLDDLTDEQLDPSS